MDGFDAALARYRAFLASEPIAPLLRRSLALLVPDNIRIDTVTPDDSLRCTTDGTSVTVGGAAYLLRADFDARHWTAALRVLLARELQHDGSSDRDVCAAVRAFSGAYFHEHYALTPEHGALLGQRILNILEQARTDNILCRRFPGYLPLLRFVCYAQLDAAAPGSALEALLDELEAFTLTGIPCRTPALQSVCAQVEAAILAPSAAACAQHCRQTLTTLAPELARLCREADDDARARIASQCVDYAFSETEPVSFDQSALPPLPGPAPAPWLTSDWIQNAFYTRMLFSCLVDADFQDTQNFMEGAPAPRGGSAAISELLDKVRSRAATYLACKRESAIGRQRNRVLRACIDGGQTLPQGLYTLTVPTGGGKTFSSLAPRRRISASAGSWR